MFNYFYLSGPLLMGTSVIKDFLFSRVYFSRDFPGLLVNFVVGPKQIWVNRGNVGVIFYVVEVLLFLVFVLLREIFVFLNFMLFNYLGALSSSKVDVESITKQVQPPLSCLG